MDNQEELEKLIDKLMVNDSLDQPSLDFTENVLAKLPGIQNAHFVYKPLLPKSIFIIGAFLVLSLVVVILKNYGFSEIDSRYINNLNDMGASINNFFGQDRFSKTATYVIILGGFLFFVQTLILKKHVDSRFA
ncbi:hypothetical protein [Croceitalea vernalis]|uniref:DUF3379 domain-containing protein n=1 Tax=Croceitalea vernalis TaxID=3075599 RepID=A0ABU3BKW6_9FLAO|nr:hypothetical protein [Croceitalea sp. P007]MDT0622804.1 hypothetical protein [Croceitalea sp. P007]